MRACTLSLADTLLLSPSLFLPPSLSLSLSCGPVVSLDAHVGTYDVRKFFDGQRLFLEFATLRYDFALSFCFGLFPSLSHLLSLSPLLSLARSHASSLHLSLTRFLAIALFLSLALFFFCLLPRCFYPSHTLSLSFSDSLPRFLASFLHVSPCIPLFSLALLDSLAFPLSLAPSSLHFSLTCSLVMTRLFSRSLTPSLPLFLPLSVSHHPSLRVTPLRWISALIVEACDIRINLNVQRSVLEFATLQYGIHSLPRSLFRLSVARSPFLSLARSLSPSLPFSSPPPTHTSPFLLLSLPRTCGGTRRSAQTRVMSD